MRSASQYPSNPWPIYFESVNIEYVVDGVSQFFRRLNIMDEPQVLYPIADRMIILLAQDDARMFYALRRQLDEVVVFCTYDASHFGSALQVNRIIDAQRTANDVDTKHAQLSDNLR